MITIIPRIILYIPNPLKLCLLIYPISPFITAVETTKATIQARNNINSSEPDSMLEYLKTLRRLAPSITGIASIKVNSTATGLAIPIRSAPIIVAPDLDVPGNIAATN